MIGETLGRYEIVEHIGHGSMAEVYKAHQLSLDRHVAIKVLHSFLSDDKNFLTRFQREAKAVARLRHPNIVQVYDFDYDEGQGIYYMVMEFIDGPSLKVKLEGLSERGEGISLDEALRIVTRVGEALDYAHRQGIIHRDVKPSNIMFNSDGEIILTDFGIVKMIDRRGLTASGAMVGTPAYISPEFGMGKAGREEADIYSLGVVLYQLVTGSLPFEAETPMGIVLKHIEEPVPNPKDLHPDLPVEVEQALLKALAKDPEERFETAGEFVAMLRQAPTFPDIQSPKLKTGSIVPEGQASPTHPPSRSEAAPSSSTASTPVPQSGRRTTWAPLAIGSLVLLLLLGAVTGFLAYRGRLGDILGNLGVLASTPNPNLAATRMSGTMVAMQATMEASTETPTLSPTTSATPTPSPSPTSTPTPDLTATAIAGCIFDVEVVRDQPIWPTVLMPEQQFVKRWEIKNVGTCAWPVSTELVIVSGDEGLEVTERPVIEPLAPGKSTEIAVTLEAPQDYGSYTTAWQLQSKGQEFIGRGLKATYRVGPTPTPEVSPTPREALWMSRPFLASCEGGGGRSEWRHGGGPSDEYRYFYGEVRPDRELAGPYHEFEGFPHPEKYLTVSGDLSFPVPEECGKGNEGRCSGPEGKYVIVWKIAWFTQEHCP